MTNHRHARRIAIRATCTALILCGVVKAAIASASTGPLPVLAIVGARREMTARAAAAVEAVGLPALASISTIGLVHFGHLDPSRLQVSGQSGAIRAGRLHSRLA